MIKCGACGQGFARQEKLNLHMESKHPTDSQKLERTCPICGKVAKSKKYLDIHMRKHQEKTSSSRRSGWSSKRSVSGVTEQNTGVNLQELTTKGMLSINKKIANKRLADFFYLIIF